MKPFIEGEIERLQSALKPLIEMNRRLSILKGIDPVKQPHTFSKAQNRIESLYNEYEKAKSEILESWESEEKQVPELTPVMIAECFDWHPHEIV